MKQNLKSCAYKLSEPRHYIIKESSVHYVYVLQSVTDAGDFYVGFSSDLRRRFEERNSGRNVSTRHSRWRLVYYEAYVLERAARKREASIKNDGRVRRFLMDRVKRGLE